MQNGQKIQGFQMFFFLGGSYCLSLLYRLNTDFSLLCSELPPPHLGQPVLSPELHPGLLQLLGHVQPPQPHGQPHCTEVEHLQQVYL